MKPASFAPVYVAIYPELAEVARKHGYALAIHGSISRDFDLICIPWIENPSVPESVVKDMEKQFSISSAGMPTEHEHGRIVYSMCISFGDCFVDLSFMPTKEHQPCQK